MVAYVVEALDEVALVCEEPLKSMDWMSPFVWREDGTMRMLMRGVPSPLRPGDPTGFIWCGKSDDGLTFTMESEPLITPGPDPLDAAGVEDPTAWATDEETLVYYTGVEKGRHQGSLLVAHGPDLHRLKQRAVMMKAPEGHGNIKEATLARAADGSWRLFYEFARDNASRIGMATASVWGQQWQPHSEPIPVRPDAWDNWHLSTGPIVQLPDLDPVMFYNGATIDARWRIGWASLDPDLTEITGRCIEPILIPPPDPRRLATDIAFAASTIVVDDRTIHLYYSLDDRTLARATVIAYGEPRR